MTPKIAFVIPWFGFDLAGGAESNCRDLAIQLSRRGFSVEVLTTCVRELASNWNENYHKPGVFQEQGITIRRFPADRTDHTVFNSLNSRLLRGEALSYAEEIAFLKESVNSEALTGFIDENRAAYFFFFTPYLFGTTFWGSLVAPDRAALIPCLHDEAYASMKVMALMFEKVRGVIFNSPVEKELSERLFDLGRASTVMLGVGVDDSIAASPESCKISEPFILYAGRKDKTKNVDLLLRYFGLYKRRHPSDLKLVLIGNGQLEMNEDCVDLGLVDAREKSSLFAAARVLCQPSVHESFSKVIMEAWLCETPVLVNGHCSVTRDHVERSQGGLFFEDYFEFECCLDCLLENPSRAAEMARHGKSYVLQNYTWDKVMGRFEAWYPSLF
ncbi:MAG: glycosyltransferase family 4 protein [Acidobacteria bacterium]|nr:glycosyltransferase family 4 protein [Acidobacteriota bacterium]